MSRTAYLLAILLAATAAIGDGAVGGPAQLRPADLGESHLAPRISPDGNRVVFEEAYTPPRGGGTYDLALVTVRGPSERPLFPKPGASEEQYDRDARWSPDGSKVAFTRELGLSTSDLMVVGSDGTGLLTLTPRGESEEADPEWSPEGSRVAFSRRDAAARPRAGIWIVQADGGGERQLTRGNDVDPSWSPDGTRIAFERIAGQSQTIWVVPVTGGEARRLTAGGRYALHGWSGKRDEILFTRDGGYVETRASIWSMRADGSGQRRLVSGDEPHWSPDATRLAFVRWSRRGGRAVSTVFVANGNGTEARRIFPGAIGSWSRDGRRLAISAAAGCNGAGIVVHDVVSRKASRLTNDCRVRGTARSERLAGSRERDLVWGAAGNDVIDANPGDRPNVFFGRLDDDVVRGGAGNDRIWGRRGSDHLDGGPGADRLDGGRGPDVLAGGPGRDRLLGGPYYDRLLPGLGRDTVLGGAGRDTIYAGDGRPDRIVCGPGRDRVEADHVDLVAADCELVRR